MSDERVARPSRSATTRGQIRHKLIAPAAQSRCSGGHEALIAAVPALFGVLVGVGTDGLGGRLRRR